MKPQHCCQLMSPYSHHDGNGSVIFRLWKANCTTVHKKIPQSGEYSAPGLKYIVGHILVGHIYISGAYVLVGYMY